MRIGELDMNSDPDCHFLNPSFCAPPKQDITVERIIKHPSYNIECTECNDIALVRLSRPAVFDTRSKI